MPKIAVITDQHFGCRNDSTIFLDYNEKFYSQIFFPKLDELGIDTVLDLGDTFDRRKYVNFLTLQRSKTMYFDELAKRNITLHAIVGNHSTFYKNSNDVNSLDLLLKEYPTFNLYINDPVELQLGSCRVMLSPWLCDQNYDLSMRAFQETKATILMGHFAFNGYEMMKGTVSDGGLNRTDFKKFDQVYSGHFHHPSSMENITYLGAPYEMVWSDYNGKRGFHIFDTETLEMKFVQNPFTMFNRLDYNDDDLTIDQINNLDLSVLKGTYVKIFVKEKKNPYIFDLFLDKIQSSSPVDIKVINEEVTSSFTEEIEFDENQDTLSFLKTYVSNLETKVDKLAIDNFITGLYQEAVNI